MDRESLSIERQIYIHYTIDKRDLLGSPYPSGGVGLQLGFVTFYSMVELKLMGKVSDGVNMLRGGFLIRFIFKTLRYMSPYC